MDSRWIWGVVLVIIVAAGGWYALSRSAGPAPAAVDMKTQQATTPDTGPGAAMAPAPVTVAYTDQGFSPASVTVAQGQSVTWVNQSSGQMWVASGVHPTHTVYDGTSKDRHCAPGYSGSAPFDECTAVPAGGSFTFTFDKAGNWKYHNHVDAGDTGEVIVTAAPAGANGVSVTASTSVNVR